MLKEDLGRSPTGQKIVLVHPSASIMSTKGRGLLYGDLSAAGSQQPPQGISMLAAILRENGYKPEIIDAEPMGLGADETAELAMEDNPKYIGISSYTATIEVSVRIAQKVKEIASAREKEVNVIIGGPHVTFLPKNTIEKYSVFDFGIPGEGEITIVELVDAIEHGEPLERIPNLIYRKGSEICLTRKRTLLNDMDELPLPAWELLPRLDKFYHPAGDNIFRLPAIAIVTSRGCPGKCVFCNPRGLGVRFRRHSAEYIIRMLRYLQGNFGIRDVFIVDDMFVTDGYNAMEFCRLLKQSKDLDITWSVFARVDSVDKELLKVFKDARCWQVGYGLESGSEKILKIINKGQTVSQMEKAIKDANEVGMVVRGLFMVGNFGETKETLEETVKFIKRNPIKDFHVTCFTPMPGTISFKKWKEYGDWTVNTDEGSTKSQHAVTFVPYGLTKDILISYQKRFYKALFMKPRVIWYQFRKVLRPSLTLFVLNGGLSFIKYTMFKKVKC